MGLWAGSLTLNPGPSVVQTISRYWPTRKAIHYAHDSSERIYSPMILTNTRFHRRPSRLPGQPVRLALKDALPRAKGSGEQSETILPTVGHRDHNLAAHHAQLRELRSASAASRRCALPPFRTEACRGQGGPTMADGGVGCWFRQCHPLPIFLTKTILDD